MVPIQIMGTSLFSDLLASEVRREYNTLLGVGISFEDAESFVIEGFSNSFIPEHESVFWLALAYMEHKYGVLSDKVREKALYAIDSGEDLKKWENAVAYSPYYRYISTVETEDRRFKILCDMAKKKIGEKPEDCVEESFHDFQVRIIKRMVEEYPRYKHLLPAEISGKKIVPVPKPDFEPDAFFGQISINCEKNLKKRREVLQNLREYLTTPQPPKKPKKESGRPCPWEAGDVVAIKTHSAGMNKIKNRHAELYFKEHGIRPKTCLYEDGKYIILIILKVIRKPVSNFVPVEIVSEDDAIVGYYDYYGDVIPDKSELENIPFIKWNGPFSSVHTAVSLGFYHSARFMKKTEWKIIEHFENFPEEIPEFFKGGVMGAQIENFSDDVFDFVILKQRKMRDE